MIRTQRIISRSKLHPLLQQSPIRKPSFRRSCNVYYDAKAFFAFCPICFLWNFYKSGCWNDIDNMKALYYNNADKCQSVMTKGVYLRSMDITIIRATSRKNSSTYNAAKYFISKLDNVGEVFEFILPEDMPHICKGCYACLYGNEDKCGGFKYLEPINAAFSRSEICFPKPFNSRISIMPCFRRKIPKTFS